FDREDGAEQVAVHGDPGSAGGLAADADVVDDVEALAIQSLRELRLQQRRFARAGRRVEEDDAIGKKEVKETRRFNAAAIQLLPGLERARADVGIDSILVGRTRAGERILHIGFTCTRFLVRSSPNACFHRSVSSFVKSATVPRMIVMRCLPKYSSRYAYTRSASLTPGWFGSTCTAMFVKSSSSSVLRAFIMVRNSTRSV